MDLVAVEDNGDHVEENFSGHIQVVGIQVFACSCRDTVLLGGADLVLQSRDNRGGTGLDLDEMDPVLRFGDDVHLQMSSAPVPFQDPVSARGEKVAGELLPALAECFASLVVHLIRI